MRHWSCTCQSKVKINDTATISKNETETFEESEAKLLEEPTSFRWSISNLKQLYAVKEARHINQRNREQDATDCFRL